MALMTPAETSDQPTEFPTVVPCKLASRKPKLKAKLVAIVLADGLRSTSGVASKIALENKTHSTGSGRCFFVLFFSTSAWPLISARAKPSRLPVLLRVQCTYPAEGIT
jgi:hypothetical protein